MRPTLRQMEYIVTVHQLGGFGLAAEKLNVSQPSLSAFPSFWRGCWV